MGTPNGDQVIGRREAMVSSPLCTAAASRPGAPREWGINSLLMCGLCRPSDSAGLLPTHPQPSSHHLSRCFAQILDASLSCILSI